jgi:hypothetical protein
LGEVVEHSFDDQAEKTCPILAAFAGNKAGEQASGGKFWAVRCKKEGCGWWDASRSECAVVGISREIGDIVTAGFLTKPAG